MRNLHVFVGHGRGRYKCGTFRGPAKTGQKIMFKCRSRRIERYVAVTQSGRAILQLAEVKVFSKGTIDMFFSPLLYAHVHILFTF